MELIKARRIAEELVKILRPACERVEIAGSIRREKPDVKDIELVAVPRWVDRVPPGGMFAESVAPVYELLDRLVDCESSCFARGEKWGNKYRKLLYTCRGTGIAVDLFLCSPHQWGYLFALRTGPADFSRLLVTPVDRGGALPAGYRCHGGNVERPDGCTVKLPEEEDFFGLLNLPCWPARRRSEWLLREHLDRSAMQAERSDSLCR
jgi:DNA polymerase/3'-5' exonuclease PolX